MLLQLDVSIFWDPNIDTSTFRYICSAYVEYVMLSEKLL